MVKAAVRSETSSPEGRSAPARGGPAAGARLSSRPGFALYARFARALRPGSALDARLARALRPAFCAVSVILSFVVLGCGSDGPPPKDAPGSARGQTLESAFLDTLEERTFRYFWELSDSRTGLTPDRWPTKSFVSIAATGFALTAYPIGAERGYVTRSEAAERVLATLDFLWALPQDSLSSDAGGFHGFFYHFLEPETGHRFADVELSTQDTALLMAGVLFCGTYFDGKDAVEESIRASADRLFARVDWRWAQARPPLVSHGYTPEEGFLPYDWAGYNESMLLPILALGSPAHPIGADAWQAWTAPCRWGTFHGQEHVGFAPLFGHQYTHCWIDLRGIRDAFMRDRGIDYFENSRRATLAQHAYAIENPGGWRGYGEHLWGLTACDGPVDSTIEIDGRERRFHTYMARGASFTEVQDDGTVAPTAAAASIVFTPEIVIPALLSMRQTYGEHLFSRYGFVDAFNPTLRAETRVQHGRVVAGAGWFDTDYLGIDQGPILIMIENHRSGFVWEVMRRNPVVVAGLRAAGFAGGWLDSAAVAP